MIMRALGLVVAGLATGGVAGAADTVKLLPGPFEFPTEFAGMKYQGEPTRFNDPRLGTGYIFTGDHLLFMAYVFDNGIKDIADGGDTIVACKAFEAGKVEVEQTTAYSEPRLAYEQLVRLASPDGTVAREAKYQVQSKGKSTDTYLFVTAAAGQILKLRLLASPGHDEELVTARHEALRLLEAAIGPYLSAQKSAPAKSEPSITFYGGNDAKELQVATNYTLALSAVADKFPEHAPVCGGDFVPTLDEEVATYQVMLDLFGDLNDGSTFGRKLRDIAAAGYLEEYAWTYVHRDSWGTEPPTSLTLPDFDAWRAKHLKRFKPPVFGTVQFDRARALPVDAHPW
jgi:hypothetical protein